MHPPKPAYEDDSNPNPNQEQVLTSGRCETVIAGLPETESADTNWSFDLQKKRGAISQ
jgi:hypothetical protein